MRLMGGWRGLKHALLLGPPRDRPLPLWMLFPVLFALLYISHFPLLRLPYYWDELGYYIPAAWDFFRTGSLIPITTLTNAHPPLPSVYLALWWKLSGFAPEGTRVAVLLVAAFALLAVGRLGLKLNGKPAVAIWTVGLTALYPIWFAQSTLAHADIFAAAATLWGLVYALPDRNPRSLTSPVVGSLGGGQKPWVAAIWFSLAALSKETAIATPLILAAFEVASGFRKRGAARRRAWSLAAWCAACVLPLAAWYLYHYRETGFLFGNPEYLRYNATQTLTPLRIAAAFLHRLFHLTGHMNLFVPVLCTAAAMLLDPLPDETGRARPLLSLEAQWRIYAILLGNALAFSVLGGALLTRYLLPMYPLVLLVAVSTFYRRARYWWALAAFAGAAFVMALFLNPPYGFAPEDNLAYAQVIRLHQDAIRVLVGRYSGATVLTAWPVSDELTRPELGYVKTPFDVYRLEDFSQGQIAKAATAPGSYSAALVFSTKTDPGAAPLSLPAYLGGGKSMEEKYFGLHEDLEPRAIADALNGQLVWEERGDGQWAAVIRFPRQVEATLPLPAESAPGRFRP